LARGSQAGSSQVTNLMESTASFAYRNKLVIKLFVALAIHGV
jgi:hypothetical protein